MGIRQQGKQPVHSQPSVSTGFPLTSTTRPYRELSCRLIEVAFFFLPTSYLLVIDVRVVVYSTLLEWKKSIKLLSGISLVQVKSLFRAAP